MTRPYPVSGIFFQLFLFKNYSTKIEDLNCGFGLRFKFHVTSTILQEPLPHQPIDLNLRRLNKIGLMRGIFTSMRQVLLTESGNVRYIVVANNLNNKRTSYIILSQDPSFSQWQTSRYSGPYRPLGHLRFAADASVTGVTKTLPRDRIAFLGTRLLRP